MRVRAIPHREGEHPAQLLGRRLAAPLEHVQHGLGVAVRAGTHALRLELRHQRRVVEHLAVVDELQRAVVARHRLLAVRDVHDAEPAMAERDAAAP